MQKIPSQRVSVNAEKPCSVVFTAEADHSVDTVGALHRRSFPFFWERKLLIMA